MKLIILIALLTTSSVFAASKKIKNAPIPMEPQTLKELAEESYKVPSEKKKNASDIQITSSSLLKLEDPKIEVSKRTYQLVMSLKAQPFQARGVAENSLHQNFELSNSAMTVLPGFEAGISQKYFMLQREVEVSYLGQASFVTQAHPVTMNSGFSVDDTRLSSTLILGGVDVAVDSMSYSHVQYLGSVKLGNLNYTQTSSNTFAQFSKNTAVYSLGIGAAYSLNTQWKVLANYSYRNTIGQTALSTQPHNFEFGARLLW